jgi:hypothetical protein
LVHLYHQAESRRGNGFSELLDAIFGSSDSKKADVRRFLRSLSYVERQDRVSSLSVQVEEEGEGNLNIRLQASASSLLSGQGSARVKTGQYTKARDLGWWVFVTLSEPIEGEEEEMLLALKKVSAKQLERTKNVSLSIPHPSSLFQENEEEQEEREVKLTVYLCCDSYLGLDEQVHTKFTF